MRNRRASCFAVALCPTQATGSPLELDALETVFLKLLSDAAPREAAVTGAPRHIAVVPGEDPHKVLALDLAYQVVGKLRKPLLYVDESTARELPWQPGRQRLGKVLVRMNEPLAKAIADLIAFSSSRTLPGHSC